MDKIEFEFEPESRFVVEVRQREEGGLQVDVNWFYNGTILEESADFFIMQEDYEGRLPIFYIEVLEIEEYKPRGENG